MQQQPNDGCMGGMLPYYPQIPNHPFPYGNIPDPQYPTMLPLSYPTMPPMPNHMIPPFFAPPANMPAYGQVPQPVMHGYHAQMPPNASQHPAPAPPSTIKQCPNPEPRPGGESEIVADDIRRLLMTYIVFGFQVEVSDGDSHHNFIAETDMTWEVFQKKVLQYLESATCEVELTCKVSGDTGKASQMKDEADYKSVIERVCQRAQNAHTRAVSLEIKNIVSMHNTLK